MKFGEQISSHLTPEWRKQYVQYEALKKIITEIVANAPEEEAAKAEYFKREDVSFFKEIEEEVTKMNLFFSMKMAEVQRKFHELQHDLDILKAKQEGFGHKKHSLKLKKDATTKTVAQLKFAFSEFYLMLLLIQNYQQLNETGFRKILKKHDKMLETDRGAKFRKEKIMTTPLFTNKDVNQLIAKTENAVANELEKGDRHAAMKRLRVQPVSEAQNAWTTFRLGLYLGAFIVLCAVVVALVIDREAEMKKHGDNTIERESQERYWVAGIHLFRGSLLIMVNCWLLGLNVYGWQTAGVNHVLIFGIDPRNHLTYQQMMEIASYLGMVWGLCVCGYLIAPLLGHSPLIYPLICFASLLIWLLNPLTKPHDWMHRSSRYWLLKIVYKCLAAPWYAVAFADFWMGDQMNSLTTSFLDFGYLICFYSTQVVWFSNGRFVLDFVSITNRTTPISNVDSAITALMQNASSPISPLNETSASGAVPIYDYCHDPRLAWWRPLITLVPPMVRFLQCLRRYRDGPKVHPHLTNAGKYCTSFLVIGIGTARAVYAKNNINIDFWNNPWVYIWICSYVVAFCYAYMWDLFMDWGLMHKQYAMLREELAYHKKWYYYFAIVADGLLRLSWTLNVGLSAADIKTSHGAFQGALITDTLLCVTGALECFRRFVWNYLRLENEHLNNCGNFRAVRDISLKPIKKGALESLLDKMDEDDGVVHRGNQTKNKKSFLDKLENLEGSILRKTSQFIHHEVEMLQKASDKLSDFAHKHLPHHAGHDDQHTMRKSKSVTFMEHDGVDEDTIKDEKEQNETKGIVERKNKSED